MSVRRVGDAGAAPSSVVRGGDDATRIRGRLSYGDAVRQAYVTFTEYNVDDGLQKLIDSARSFALDDNITAGERITRLNSLLPDFLASAGKADQRSYERAMDFLESLDVLVRKCHAKRAGGISWLSVTSFIDHKGYHNLERLRFAPKLQRLLADTMVDHRFDPGIIGKPSSDALNDTKESPAVKSPVGTGGSRRPDSGVLPQSARRPEEARLVSVTQDSIDSLIVPHDRLNKYVCGFKDPGVDVIERTLEEHREYLVNCPTGASHPDAALAAYKNIKNLVDQCRALSKAVPPQSLWEYLRKSPENGVQSLLTRDELVDMHLGHWLRTAVGSMTKYAQRGSQYVPQVERFLRDNKDVFRAIVQQSADIARRRISRQSNEVNVLFGTDSAQSGHFKAHLRESFDGWSTHLDHLPFVGKMIYASVSHGGTTYQLRASEVREAYDAAVITHNALVAAGDQTAYLQSVFNSELRHRLFLLAGAATRRHVPKNDYATQHFIAGCDRMGEARKVSWWRRLFGAGKREYDSALSAAEDCFRIASEADARYQKIYDVVRARDIREYDRMRSGLGAQPRTAPRA